MGVPPKVPEMQRQRGRWGKADSLRQREPHVPHVDLSGVC